MTDLIPVCVRIFPRLTQAFLNYVHMHPKSNRNLLASQSVCAEIEDLLAQSLDVRDMLLMK